MKENSIEEDIKILNEMMKEKRMEEDVKILDEMILNCRYKHNYYDEYAEKKAKVLEKCKKALKENEELKKHNEKYIIHLTDEQYKIVIENAQNDINQKWIQKVKDSIEEIDKIYNDIPEDEGNFAKAILIKEKQVLQELLEGRK